MSVFSGAVAASGDDAHEASGGTVNITATASISIDGTNEWLGLRFQSVTIPPGATINTATASVVPTTSGGDEPDVTIYCQLGSAAAFAATGNNISSRTRTTASVNWGSADLGANGTTAYDTANFASAVQEVVNGTWSSGDNLAVVMTSRANDTARDLIIFMYDNGSLYAECDIDYTAGQPAAARQPWPQDWYLAG